MSANDFTKIIGCFCFIDIERLRIGLSIEIIHYSYIE